MVYFDPKRMGTSDPHERAAMYLASGGGREGISRKTGRMIVYGTVTIVLGGLIIWALMDPATVKRIFGSRATPINQSGTQTTPQTP